MALPLSYNLRNVRQRWKTSLLAVVGIALVVTVLVGLDALSAGLRQTLRSTGSEANAIVVQKGATSELTSGIGNDDAAILAVDRRVARGADGRPLASPEMVVIASMERRTDGEPTNVLLRGTTPETLRVRAGIELVAGRLFTPGLGEIVVGVRASDRIKDLQVGRTITLKRRSWTVVGVFAAQGSGFESEIWGDAAVMRQAFNRTGGWQSVTVRLADPSALDGLKQDLEANPQLQVEVARETDFYEKQAGGTARAILVLGAFVSVVMGIGAVFGAMNTMYGIVAARTREIGTLRALGFPRWAILVGFLLESLAISLVGGVLGVLLAFPLQQLTFSSAPAFSEIVYAFRITPEGIFGGLRFALAMGLLGGVLPAIRAARVPVFAALRDA